MAVHQSSLLVLLAWGALAFGAEYAWAFAPLLVLAITAGLLGLRASAGVRLPSRSVLVMLAVLTAAVGAQLLPLPAAAKAAMSGPGSINYAALYKAAVMQDLPAQSPAAISIAQSKTMLGLCFLVALTALLAGTARALSNHDPRRVARGVMVLAAVVASVGILQTAIQSTVLYGFWRTPKSGVPFAPFVNANHFAGWMVMAMSLSAGVLAADVSGAARRGWRGWLLSPEGSQSILRALGVGIMALAMVVAGSRGGLLGLLTATLISAAWVLWRQPSRASRALAATVLVAIFVVAATQGRVYRIIDEFAGSTLTWGGRQAVWHDTWRIIQDYPWAGTGLNTYGIAMLHYQTIPRGEFFIEAHNDYLQLAAEGGLLLGIPILITIALFIREVWRRFKEGADDERTYWLRAGAVTGLISIAVMEVFDFTLQMPGAAVLFVVLAAIAIHRPDYLTRRREARAHRE